MKIEITDTRSLDIRSSVSMPIHTIPHHPAFRRLLEELVVASALDAAKKATTETLNFYRGRMNAFNELLDLISKAPEE